uniref:ATP-binding cassette transporter n=1 Tax=Kwoniella bestiolae CBS 10118 TaxID=1296100 RepID=A0A1B9FYV3_9TREE|nr:ATP-binding cassette transporter [Kwoniella bestiolae CBS 10118]OCF23957.1 ATP-binding cassette transporter [Kwoniella bestiolae CBS 10118]
MSTILGFETLSTKVAEIASKATCEDVWDGTDFTRCFKERYISNFPLILIALSALYILGIAILPRYLSSSPYRPISPDTLISPSASSDLAKLESNVILDAVASNLKPSSKSSARKGRLSDGEAEQIVNDWKDGSRKSESKWRRLRFWVGLIGALAWFELEIARGAIEGSWKDAILPAWLALIALVPSSPLTAILTIHILPSLILFRSNTIQPHTSSLRIASGVVEVVYWVAMISIPYSEGLDRLLDGGVSQGGGTSGSYGEKLPKHCEEPASTFSRATYSFLLPLLFKHYFKPITLNDIPAIREDDSASSSLGAFRAFRAGRDKDHVAKTGEKRIRNLGADLFWFFLPELAMQCIWAIVFVMFQYLPPTGLRLLLQYVKERDTSSQPGHVAVLYVAMMAGGQILSVILMGQSLFIGRRLCIRMRAIIISDVFAKALRRRDLSGNVKKTKLDKNGKIVEDPEAAASEGKIANLVSVDAFTISEICAYVYYLVSCPFAVILNSYLLYKTLGAASFAGTAVLIALMPLQGLIGRLYTIYQKRFMAATDARLESVTEVIAHIKLIKFNAWEDKFFERMGITRKKELGVLALRFATTTLFQVFVWGTPVLVTGVAFAVHSMVLKQPLTADRAFASLILFNMLKDPLALFQDTLTRLLQAYTSCGRIQAYLDEPDTLKYRQLSTPSPGEPTIGFKNAILGYATHEDLHQLSDEDAEPFVLGELDLAFPVGGLSIIAGPVGSGKTTLILGLLGEAMLLQGKVFMPDDHANRDICPIDPATGLADTIAYCSQTPWLIGASIKENIVFGSEWDSERYNAVVDACALRRDFEIFELGDETEVGEKGTTCSGGQKARIALARAVYSPAKTIILDDVLSAVDAQTARHLYDNVLRGELIEGRTVIMVTHQVSLVAPASKFVVMLDNGGVVASGTPSELSSEGLLDLHGTDTKDKTQDLIEPVLDDQPIEISEAQKQQEVDKATEQTSEEVKLDKQLVSAETSGQGMVGIGTYWLYFRSMGSGLFWFIVIFAFLGSQVLQIANNTWIKEWANANDHPTTSSSVMEIRRMVIDNVQAQIAKKRSTLFYLTVYWGISACYILAVAGRVGITFFGALTASQRLYGKLVRRILGAKMRFFDSTPSGRIMNRLSKDMSSIDQEAGEILMYFANSCLSAAAILVVVTVSTPAFLVALVLIVLAYWLLGSLYVTTNREIKRIDSVTRSPIFISFSEVLVGMSTIRSYGDSARFMRKLFHEVDQNTRCFWYLWQINRLLNNFSNFIGAFVTIFAAVFALRNPEMDAGAVGLSITYALSFTEYVLWVVRLYAASEMSMNSVERVGEYLELEVEEEEHAKGIEPPAHWPSREGSVVVENLTCRYAPQLDPVLQGVSFTIGPREKIGVCGRTGSGKSTLALSFFRFLHQDGGKIVIDGLDISKLSLNALRSRLTILPQEAQLFSGTTRDNLDPFDQHSDESIWEALSQCGLINTKSRNPSRVQSKSDLTALTPTKTPSKKTLRGQAIDPNAVVEGEEEEERVMIRSLEEKVAVGGKNFSQGQRQLLALARGLLKLRSSSFLIMDESTANLDHATDATIQNVLRSEMKDVQMIVIAHRLMTVCGLDKILVLDHGKVVEFGTPYELMQKENGSFRELCKQSGEETQLLELAKQVHESRSNGDRTP